ncbi:hypothetical protein [Rossellomorea arthrocnemi]|uniref:hypothetical protein n=1 Tax=Rossellomorea arthrocnemi TaxID=2769542 RepID=UPI001918AAF3|nr:hypothetical protein [Rossellomorea arthrocnemi]
MTYEGAVGNGIRGVQWGIVLEVGSSQMAKISKEGGLRYFFYKNIEGGWWKNLSTTRLLGTNPYFETEVHSL